MGIMAGAAMGRDLRNVQHVIGVGGIFVYNEPAKAIEMIDKAFENPGISLFPLYKPSVMIDKDYILYALGVLGKHFPDVVLDFMKKHYIK